MEKSGEDKMFSNLFSKTGKHLEQWIHIVQQQQFTKHSDAVVYLKTEHGLGHSYSDMIVHKANKTDSGSMEDKEALVTAAFQGKEHWKPTFDLLINDIAALGSDIEISPKKGYVSLRRKKQFVTLKPATRTRFEIGIFLKGQTAEGILKAVTDPNAMHSHLIQLESQGAFDADVLKWIKLAYDRAS